MVRRMPKNDKTKSATKGVENLKPVRTVEEAREKGRKGGVKSGEARREKKLLKDTLLLLLETNRGQEDICLALVEKARNGDTKAFEVIRDTIGQKPVDKAEVETNGSITVIFNIPRPKGGDAK